MADDCRPCRFAGFRLDPQRRELRAPDGHPLPLPASAFDVLCHLIAHRDRVVGKAELIAAAWPGRVVEDGSLAQAVRALRRAFGTEAGERRFVLTVPGRGYRFVAPLEPDGPAARPPAAALPVRRVPWRHWAGLAFSLLLSLSLLSAWRAPPGAPATPAAAGGGEACEGVDPEARRAVLTGRYVLARASAGRLPAALSALRAAIDRDPTCAAAWAELSHAYVAMIDVADADPRHALPFAAAAARRALRLDPASAVARLALARVELASDRPQPAQALARAALRRDPQLAEARELLATLLVGTDDAEAARQVRLALQADPLSPSILISAAAFAPGPRESRTLLERARELEPGYAGAWLQLGANALAAGQPRAAVADLERAAALSRRSAWTLSVLARAYVAAGRRDRAEAVRAELEARRREAYVSPFLLARVNGLLGHRDRALHLLAEAERASDPWLALLANDARYWTALAGDPRFDALRRRARSGAVVAARD